VADDPLGNRAGSHWYVARYASEPKQKYLDSPPSAIVNCAMRVILLVLCAGTLLAQQPIVYHRGTVNAASSAPFGLPNAPIARGSIFTIFGENLGPAAGQSVTSFPLGTSFQGVSISVTQNGVTTQAYPIFVSASQANVVMPSSVTAGPATVRAFYQNVKGNATTIQIANSAPASSPYPEAVTAPAPFRTTSPRPISPPIR
jgi:hypothetical protein